MSTQTDRHMTIDSFVKLAYCIARDYRHWSMDREDINQLAVLAICKAVDAWDSTDGTPLAAYVACRIRWELGDEIQRTKRRIKYGHLGKHDPADPSSLVEGEEGLDDLDHAIGLLPDSDRVILTEYFGLDGQPPVRRPEIARRSRQPLAVVSQSKQRSIETLRVALRA